ncbi:MAG: hypothetical protein HZA52_10090 [Planctomycetes bacterium]|nr:hypothetical protein [Planctomycetota bacterium]
MKSRVYADEPHRLQIDGTHNAMRYAPGDATSTLFGGNSERRGPVWFPADVLSIEALECGHHFHGGELHAERPTGSGKCLELRQVAEGLSCRLARLFLPDAKGARPCRGADARFAHDSHWKELVLFHEYFHGEEGHGLGASQQTR